MSGGCVGRLLGLDVASYEPESSRPFSASYFAYQVVATISDERDPAGEEFIVVVCSPSWFASEWKLAKEVANVFQIWDRHPGVIPGSSFWFMETWDSAEVEAAIALLCERSGPAPTWSALAVFRHRLARADRRTGPATDRS